MVNLVAIQKPLMHGLMKMAGVRPYTVEIQPGTNMNMWVPNETISKPKKGEKPELAAKPSKPVVVLVHGFAAEGIVTWQFQVGALTKNYSVYVPDLLFFGGSITDKSDRSPQFQAECLATGLRKLGVEKCTVVGFSYGGMVAFKLAELYPELVEAMVISGSILAMTCSVSDTTMERLGFSSSSELLLPTSVKGLKALLSIAAYKKLWFPDRLHKDYLEVCVELNYRSIYISFKLQLFGKNTCICMLDCNEVHVTLLVVWRSEIRLNRDRGGVTVLHTMVLVSWV